MTCKLIDIESAGLSAIS